MALTFPLKFLFI